MGSQAFPRSSGRGITTSDRFNQGPRCSICKDFVAVATTDPNGNLVCPDCAPQRFDGLVEVVPRGREGRP
jgi:hypothetical protein